MSTPTRTSRRSICTPVTEQGSHSFEISGYSLHKGMAKGDHISSGGFSVGGHDWAIRFIPNGCCPDPGDGGGPTRPPFISIFLLLLSKGAKVLGIMPCYFFNRGRNSLTRFVGSCSALFFSYTFLNGKVSQ